MEEPVGKTAGDSCTADMELIPRTAFLSQLRHLQVQKGNPGSQGRLGLN